MYSSCRVHSELRRFWRFAQACTVASCCSRHCIVAPAHHIRAIRTCKHLECSKSIHNFGANEAATVGCAGPRTKVRRDRINSALLGLLGALPNGAYSIVEIALVAKHLSSQTSRAGTAMQHPRHLLAPIDTRWSFSRIFICDPPFVGPSPPDTSAPAPSYPTSTDAG